MTQLVKVTQQFIGDNYIQAVDARQLYLGLGLTPNKWARWNETNIINNKFFKQDVDFIELPSVGSSPNPAREFGITIRFAQHLAMMADTDNSHMYRDYFIACEEQLKQVQRDANFKYINRQIAREEAIPMLDTYDDCMVMNGKSTGKYDHANEFDMINKIVLGLTAQQYKLTHGIDLHEKSIRDYLSTLELEAICKLQAANTMMLEEGIDTQSERRERLTKLFDRQFAERFNKELLRLQA